MRSFVRLLLSAALVVAGAWASPSRAQAAGDVYSCVDAGNVWVVVNFKGSISGACAVTPTNGADALKKVASIEVANGMISRINGNPGTLDPNPYIYWNYFHKDPSGTSWGPWVYSSLGAGAYKPKPGSIEGWTYGATGTQMGWNPPARPAAATTAPATTAAPLPPATAPVTTVKAPVTSAPKATTTRTSQAPAPAATAPATTAPATTAAATAQATSAEASGPTSTPTADPGPSATTESAAVPSVASGSAEARTETSAATTSTSGSRPIDRGSPVATVATLAVIATAGAAGGGVWLLRRRRTVS